MHQLPVLTAENNMRWERIRLRRGGEAASYQFGQEAFWSVARW